MSNYVIATLAAIGAIATFHASANPSIRLDYTEATSTLRAEVLSTEFMESVQKAASKDDPRTKVRGIGWGGVMPLAIAPSEQGARGVLAVFIVVDILWDTHSSHKRDHGAIFALAAPIHFPIEAGVLRPSLGEITIADMHSWGSGSWGIPGAKKESMVRQGVLNALDDGAFVNNFRESVSGAGGNIANVAAVGLEDTSLVVYFGSPSATSAYMHATTPRQSILGHTIATRELTTPLNAAFYVTMLAENQLLYLMRDSDTNGTIDWSLLDGNQGEDQFNEDRARPGANRICLGIGSGFDCADRQGNNGHLDNRLFHGRPENERRKWNDRASIVLVEKGPGWFPRYELRVSKDKQGKDRQKDVYILEPGIHMLEMTPYGRNINENITDMWVERR